VVLACREEAKAKAAIRAIRADRPAARQVFASHCALFFSVKGTGSCSVSVADPNPYVLGLSDPDPLVRGPDPDPSFIKQK
jgi:hypothetical protein